MDIFACAHRTFSTQNQIDNRQLASKTQKFSYRVFELLFHENHTFAKFHRYFKPLWWRLHVVWRRSHVYILTVGVRADFIDGWRRIAPTTGQSIKMLVICLLPVCLWLNSSLWTRLAAVIRDYEGQATPSPDRSKDQNNISRHENTRNFGAYCRSKRYKYLPNRRPPMSLKSNSKRHLVLFSITP